MTILNGDLVSGPDVIGLVQLLGEIIACRIEGEAKKVLLLEKLCEFIGADGWTSCPNEDSSPAIQDTHNISVAFVAGGKTSLVVVFRHRKNFPFSRRERGLARILLEEVRWFHGSGAPPRDREFAMSARETEVLALLRLGNDRKTIATRLNLSPSTVAGYIRAVYRKSGVRSQIELMSSETSRRPE